jgi:hypothetical protein
MPKTLKEMTIQEIISLVDSFGVDINKMSECQLYELGKSLGIPLDKQDSHDEWRSLNDA